jgi:hypothetical protein
VAATTAAAATATAIVVAIGQLIRRGGARPPPITLRSCRDIIRQSWGRRLLRHRYPVLRLCSGGIRKHLLTAMGSLASGPGGGGSVLPTLLTFLRLTEGCAALILLTLLTLVPVTMTADDHTPVHALAVGPGR